MHKMDADGKVLDQKAFTDGFDPSVDNSKVVEVLLSLQKLIPKTGAAKICSDSATPVMPFHNEPEIMAAFEDMERKGEDLVGRKSERV